MSGRVILVTKRTELKVAGPWRVTPVKPGRVRVARDQTYVEGKKTHYIPEHLGGDGIWYPHPEGGWIPAVSITIFMTVLQKEVSDSSPE